MAATIAVGIAGLAVLLDRRTTPNTLDTVASPPTRPQPTPTTAATTKPATEVEPAPVTPVTTPTPNTVEDPASTIAAPPSTVVDLPSNPVLVDLGLGDGEVLSGEEALAAMITIDYDRVGLLRESQGFRATASLRIDLGVDGRIGASTR